MACRLHLGLTNRRRRLPLYQPDTHTARPLPFQPNLSVGQILYHVSLRTGMTRCAIVWLARLASSEADRIAPELP
jgi:hypothetical protein